MLTWSVPYTCRSLSAVQSQIWSRYSSLQTRNLTPGKVWLKTSLWIYKENTGPLMKSISVWHIRRGINETHYQKEETPWYHSYSIQITDSHKHLHCHTEEATVLYSHKGWVNRMPYGKNTPACKELLKNFNVTGIIKLLPHTTQWNFFVVRS